MSRYDAELRRRLDSGEPIQETRKWYCECMAKEKGLYWSDLTQLEQMFWDNLTNAYVAWLEQQRKIN
jgi:hypothetical protein